jgi:hypothetical protein
MKNMSQKAARKATHKAKGSASHMGSHEPQIESEGFLEPSGAMEDSTTNYDIVPGMFSGYSKRFPPRVSMGNENNGIDSGNGCNMDKLKDIKGLDQMPDAQIVGGKVYNGEKVAHLIAYGALAERLMTTDNSNEYFLIVVKLLPMDYIDTVETILDAEGYSVSRA